MLESWVGGCVGEQLTLPWSLGCHHVHPHSMLGNLSVGCLQQEMPRIVHLNIFKYIWGGKRASPGSQAGFLGVLVRPGAWSPAGFGLACPSEE